MNRPANNVRHSERPWKRWFASGSFVLVRGRDFDGRIDTMVQQVRNAAVRIKRPVGVAVSDDGSMIAVVVGKRRRP